MPTGSVAVHLRASVLALTPAIAITPGGVTLQSFAGIGRAGTLERAVQCVQRRVDAIQRCVPRPPRLTRLFMTQLCAGGELQQH